MGEDTRAANARRGQEAGLRARGPAARRAAGDPVEAGSDGSHQLGPFELDEAQLVAWGEQIGRAIAAPAVFALRGELGAGKSVFARAIARGAGVASPMPSPTFNLLFQYKGTAGRVISHLDLYRLEDPNEVWELGWRELGEGNEIVLIEWPERAEALLPAPRWDVQLQPLVNPLLRMVTLRSVEAPPDLPPPTHD